jgi:hypothetical protein
MAKSPLTRVESHWHQPIEGLVTDGSGIVCSMPNPSRR